MAAAVVPSRARAARNAPPQTNAVTYVRLDLIINHLQGDLQPEPKHYFFRWFRAGKQVKVTAAKPAAASPFAEKMALYASVRRHGPVFVSDDPSEPLDTQLVLVVTEPNTQPIVVSTVAFDIAYYINAIVEAGTKTLSTNIQMPGSISLSVSLSIKAMGDDHLHRYVPEQQIAYNNTTETPDMDEAAAALELERLRQEVREQDTRVGALEQSTDSLQDAVRRAQDTTDPNAITAAQTRIKELEDRLATTDREKSDAQRRVQAHMAHAAKIRETYERLAEWYNDLRQEHSDLRKEHTELREKVDGQTTNSAEVGDRSIPVVTSSQDTDLKSLQEERDKLQADLEKQQTEKTEMHSRNSQLLETKARALVELKEQWDSAQNALIATKQQNEEKEKAMEELKSTVQSLRSQLLERSAIVEEKEAELEEAVQKVEEIQASHAEALENMQSSSLEEARSLTQTETDEIRKLHMEELQKLSEEKNSELEASLQAEREKLETEKANEIAAIREQMRQEFDLEKSTEVEQLKTDYERKMEEDHERLKQQAVTAEEVSKASNEAAIESKVLAVRSGYEAQLAERDEVINKLEERHKEELQAVVHQKSEIDQELTSLRNATSAATASRELGEQVQTRSLEERCTRLQAELETLQKENEAMRSSPRTISSTAETDHAAEMGERLNHQIGELKSLLKTESQERNETAKRLSVAEREHDELRATITRLRSERDGAVLDLKKAKEAVPNTEIKHATLQRGTSNEQRSADALGAEEERDKAIRELFRVRKGLNKEIRKLRKENQELLDGAPSPSGTRDIEVSDAVARLTEERESMQSNLLHAQSELESAQRSLSMEMQNAAARDMQTGELQQRLQLSEGDLTTLRATIVDLQDALATSRKENADRVTQLTEERGTLLTELSTLKSTKATAEAALRDREVKLSGLTNELDSANRGLADASRGSEEVSRERDSARNKSVALATELDTLKQSLNAMSSSSSSTETMLRDAQKEVAESKAEVKLLLSEISDLKNEIQTKDAKITQETADFESATSQLRQTLDDERLSKDGLTTKTTELEGMVTTLRSKNDSIMERLASEQELKEDAEKRIAETEKSLRRLREELSQVRASELAGAEAVGRATAEREQTNRSLSDISQRAQSLDRTLKERNTEVIELQKKLSTAEAATDAMRSESGKLSEDGRALREELNAVRAELAQVQNELRKKTQQLENELAKGSELSHQETAAVRDLTGLSENLRAENSGLQSRLEAAQNEVITLRESHAQVGSKLESLERESVARDRAVSDYNTLKDAHGQLKQDMRHLSEDSVRLSKEKSSLETQLQSLEGVVDSLKTEIAAVRAENATTLREERANKEQEIAKASEIGKELRSATSLIQSLQAEIEGVKAENEKLAKEKGESPDSGVLDDLIKTRVELAWAQDEAMRLRHKLNRVAPKGSGSASFEY